MNTIKNAGAPTQLETNLLRALALMQHNGEDFFILDLQEGGVKVYEGTEEDARESFRQDIEGTDEAEIDVNFEIFCSNNLTEVEELDPEDYNNDYLVLTDEEADEKAKEYIKDSLWAFNPSFLASGCGVDEEVFKAIQNNGKCESNNEAIESLIEILWDIDSLVEDAISADGRGHFLSMYDGNENEETVNGQTFYIYRQN